MADIRVSVSVPNELIEWCEKNGVDLAAVAQAELGKALEPNLREFSAEWERDLCNLFRGSSAKSPKGIFSA